MPLQELYTFA